MNLFSEDPQFKRAQYQKLSDNISEWQEEIARMVDETLPTTMGLDSTVVFQKLDEEKGYGVGSVVVRDQRTQISVGVPILVKAWHLAPLDLFFKGEKMYPLNNENLAKAFYHPGLGVGLAPRKPPPQLADEGSIETRYPPLGGKYSYASAGDFIRGLAGTAREEDVAAFRGAIYANPSTLAKIARSGHLERFLKFAKGISDVSKADDKDDKVDKLRAVRTLTIKKDGPNEYKLYANPHNLFDPVLIEGKREPLCQYLKIQESKFSRKAEDILNDVDRNGEVTVKAPESPWGKEVLLDHDNMPKGDAVLGPQGSPFVFDPRGDNRGVVNVDKFGRYGVRDRDGVLCKGFVIPNIVNFDGSKVGEKLFIGGPMASFQNRIAGIPLNDEEINLPGAIPETGKTGVLVYQEGDKVFSTVPFQITNVTVFKGIRSLGVDTYKGDKTNLILSQAVDGIVPLAKSAKLAPLMGTGKNYLVSMRMSFVPMPRMSPVSENSDAFLKKATAESLDPNKLTISMANGRYIFRSPMLGKYASSGFDFQSLPRHEAAFLLSSWGLGTTKIATALDGVKDRIYVEVHQLHWPPVRREEKTASVQLEKLIDSFRPPMNELVKVASVLEDADSIDTVLSLGFINPENIARFAGIMPMLQRTINVLAKLLLAARLGLEDVNEDAVKSAMTHLERVVKGLGKVKMLSESEEKLSSDQKDVAAGARALAL